MTGIEPTSPGTGHAAQAATREISVLLIEDDDGDAYLVRDALADDPKITVSWVQTVSAGLAVLQSHDCVVLDLGLPDTSGLDGLRRVRASSMRTPVVVLTGLTDERQAIEALAAGAQDYLLKGQVTERDLIRTIRYAIQRHDVEDMEAELLQEQLYAEENARLERGLLPQPLISSTGVTVTARYRPGGGRMLLGGDFYDVVEDDDGTVHAVIGDVTGHGPDQAAVGVALRIAWRTLVLAGRPAAETLRLLNRILVYERHDEDIFATLCMVTISPDRSAAEAYAAGHPAPMVRRGDRWVETDLHGGPSLGLLEKPVWQCSRLDLSRSDRLLLFTDGAIEGRAGGGRLDSAGLRRLLNGASGVISDPARLDQVITEITRLNGGPLTDDLALLMLTYSAPA
jgi:serine phosphatase RsbU (regulator of sigma subunit)